MASTARRCRLARFVRIPNHMAIAAIKRNSVFRPKWKRRRLGFRRGESCGAVDMTQSLKKVPHVVSRLVDGPLPALQPALLALRGQGQHASGGANAQRATDF